MRAVVGTTGRYRGLLCILGRGVVVEVRLVMVLGSWNPQPWHLVGGQVEIVEDLVPLRQQRCQQAVGLLLEQELLRLATDLRRVAASDLIVGALVGIRTVWVRGLQLHTTTLRQACASRRLLLERGLRRLVVRCLLVACKLLGWGLLLLQVEHRLEGGGCGGLLPLAGCSSRAWTFVAILCLVEKEDLVEELDVHIVLLQELLQLVVRERVELFPEPAPDSLFLERAQLWRDARMHAAGAVELGWVHEGGRAGFFALGRLVVLVVSLAAFALTLG